MRDRENLTAGHNIIIENIISVETVVHCTWENFVRV